MTVLPDWMIKAAALQGMIQPFNEEQLNPASYDLLLGDELLIESAEGPELRPYPLASHSEERPYLLVPGQFVLASTRETFALPDFVAARFVLKSSRAREGLQHLLAGWCDPGWHGSRLTLELKNVRQLQPIRLWPGMKIGQMVFHQMAAAPDRSYAVTGRYNGHTGVHGSLG
jgi:dCTP deaminase